MEMKHNVFNPLKVRFVPKDSLVGCTGSGPIDRMQILAPDQLACSYFSKVVG